MICPFRRNGAEKPSRGNGAPSMAVTSETVLRENQTILVLGKWKDIQKCFRL